MKTKTPYDQVIALLSHMSAEDRKRVSMYLQSLSHATVQSNATYNQVDYALQQLLDYAQKDGIAVLPIPVIRKTKRYGNVDAKLQIAWDWTKCVSDQRLDRTSAFYFGIKCLKTYLRNHGVLVTYEDTARKPWYMKFDTITLNELLMYIHLMQDAVEYNFPHYVGKGLLRLIISNGKLV